MTGVGHINQLIYINIPESNVKVKPKSLCLTQESQVMYRNLYVFKVK